jgi:hypothetical protein
MRGDERIVRKNWITAFREKYLHFHEIRILYEDPIAIVSYRSYGPLGTSSQCRRPRNLYSHSQISYFSLKRLDFNSQSKAKKFVGSPHRIQHIAGMITAVFFESLTGFSHRNYLREMLSFWRKENRFFE